MANDPAFLFYPGDYLRDTQCLSESVQTAYDRIMCEHMRNICISQAQLKFFTKRLTPEQFEELLMVLKKIEGGYQIEWVAESINKRKSYSDSRSKNRKGKQPKDINNISKTYDVHMVNENEIVNESNNLKEKEIFNNLQFEILNAELWIKDSCRILKIPEVQFKMLLRQFTDELWLKKDFYKEVHEAQSHFINWIKIEITKTNKQNGTAKQSNTDAALAFGTRNKTNIDG